ncbi:SET and MYND domain-containing protein 4 [Clonorchis sinensis]|uniref:Protein-lysine N-methyltransferase SMYD4 n=1 Tax=Clonorchis sinensis TaxID=79923 RepID=G7YLQ7_CLOSI|nr:SET and MYND domain-containing protein 4 [Clonorchis sinensis]
MNTGLEAEFSRFCSTVIEAVVETWTHTDCSQPSSSSVLWPVGFSSCTTDFERVITLLRLPSVRQFSFSPASEQNHSGLKSDSRSQELRELGNSAWRTNIVADALKLYTKAIFFAESAEKKALAFANRSCVLARLGADSAVLQDIELALQYEYPKIHRSRLLVRRAESFLKLGQTKEAQDAFTQATQCVNFEDPSTNALKKLIDQGLAKCTHVLQSGDHCVGSASALPIFVRHPEPLYPPTCVRRVVQSDAGQTTPGIRGVPDPNSPIPFEVCLGDGGIGWQLVVKKSVKPGELILVDKPYARRIHKDRVYSHCYQCFRRSLNLRPCRGCSEVGFCSSSCEEAAWMPDWSSENSTNSIHGRPCHRFECGQVHRIQLDDYAGWKWFRSHGASPGTSSSSSVPATIGRYCSELQKLHQDDCVGGSKVSWLAFACIARTAPHTISDLVQSCEPNTTSPLLAFSGLRQFPTSGIHPDNYCAVGWLVSNSDKREISDLWQRTVAAVFLGHCLSYGGYPLDWSEGCFRDPIQKQRMPRSQLLPASWACACLLHHIQAVASNAHTFSVDAYFNRSDYEPQVDHPNGSPPEGVVLTDVFPFSIGSGLFPLLSLVNHSCNPNVNQVYMADGSCGLFALHAIERNEALLSNYGYHYATHPLKERRRSLLEQYHFSCQCDACVGGWFGAGELINLRCLQCRQAIVSDSGGDIARQNRETCSCPSTVQQQSMRKFSQLNQIFRDLTVSIPEDYLKRPFHKISRKLLNSHISQVVRLLNEDAFERVLVRPSMPFDYLQELLKVLLDLRYGCCFMETSKLRYRDGEECSAFS